MENQDGNKINQREEADISEIPDLALTMQAMSLADPGLCMIQDNEVKKQEVLDFSCCLIMKVASTGGTPRTLSQHSIEEALSRAWKDKFQGISQVSSSVFLAHFKSQDDMISVYIKQPWVANSENLLVDWFNPNLNAASSADYKFDSILVTVRAYGIPRNKRSIGLLRNILNQVGEVSNFHILQENNLFAKQDYIWGTAKMMVANPVKDRAVLSFEDDSSTVAYLYYEKIKRACLFCGILFHNAQDCNIRNNLITERQRNKQPCSDIPEQRYGQWIINDKYIPEELIRNARMGEQLSNQEGNAILNRLKEMFAQDPKGKSKMTETALVTQPQGNTGQIRSQGNCLSTLNSNQQPGGSKAGFIIPEIRVSNTAMEKAQLMPQIEGSSNKIDQGTAQMSQLMEMQFENNKRQNQMQKSALPEAPPRKPNQKRYAPCSEATNQPYAKKTMAIYQCAAKAPPPYNPVLSLA